MNKWKIEYPMHVQFKKVMLMFILKYNTVQYTSDEIDVVIHTYLDIHICLTIYIHI